jgi:hypothetical protein
VVAVVFVLLKESEMKWMKQSTANIISLREDESKAEESRWRSSAEAETVLKTSV